MNFLCRGDVPASACRWLHEYGGTMLKVARAYTLTAEDCQDLAQERLYAAIRQLPKADAALVLLYW